MPNEFTAIPGMVKQVNPEGLGVIPSHMFNGLDDDATFVPNSGPYKPLKGILKKAVTGVLGIFLCSRIIHTLRAQNKGGPLRDAPSNWRPC